MSPEVLQRGCISKPGDVYSFAMLMLEVWTGEVLYRGILYHQVGLQLVQHDSILLVLNC